MKTSLLAVLASISVIVSANAQTVITLNPNAADASIANNSGSNMVYDVGNYQSRVGEFFSPGVSIGVFPFQLPVLASGQQISTAELRVQLLGLDNGNGGLANVDLYGLPFRAAPDVLASDFYAGPTADTTPGVSLLQPGFLTPASAVRTDATTGPFDFSSPQGDIAITNYLNAQYANGAIGGNFVFFRLSYDQNPSAAGNNSYAVLTDDAGGAQEKPLLTLMTGPALAIPEPSSVALLIGGLGAGAVGWIRKRRARG